MQLDQNTLKFIFYVNRILMFSGCIFFACTLLFYVVTWDLHSLESTIWVLIRVILVTIFSYLVHVKLSARLNTPK